MCTSHRWAPSGASSHTAADFGTISTSSEQLLTMQRPHLLRRHWLQLEQARPQDCSTGGTGKPTAGEGEQAGVQSRVLLQAGDGDGDSQRATRTSCSLLADLQWVEPVEKVGGEMGAGEGTCNDSTIKH